MITATSNEDFRDFWEHELGNLLVSKNGINWKAYSPFRKDNNPSFSVNIETGVFNDFGDASIRGNAVQLVMRKHGLNYQEALEYIASHYANYTGLKIPAAFNPEEYCFLEIIENGFWNRKELTRIRKADNTPDYFGKPGFKDCAHSVFWHSPNLFEYARNHEGSVSGYNETCRIAEVPIDIDFKNDSEKAKTIAQSLLQRLLEGGVKADKISIAFSGNKGFHVSFFDQSFNQLCGRIDAPEKIQEVIKLFTEGIDGIDFGIYRLTGLIRSLNTINGKSNLYKIPLIPEELFSLSIESIKNLAQNQRERPTASTMSFIVPASPETMRFYSRLLNEQFTLQENNEVKFESGIIYTESEINDLKGGSKETIKAVHLVKKYFNGTVQKNINKEGK